MESEQENDGFVSAADFFRQQKAPDFGGAGKAAPRRPPRESLLVVARNSQVKNKISAFDRQGGPVMGMPAPAADACPGSGRPGPTAPGKGSSSGGFARPAARRVGAAPSLGAIAEEVAAAAPARRHAAVVSTATAAAVPPRRHAATAVATAAAAKPAAAMQPAQPALPSPETKQQLAEKRHEARFPSIMFHPPPPQARKPEPSPAAPAAAAVEQQQVQRGPRPLPSVLASARTSLTPQQQAQQQPQEEPVPARALAAVLAAEAAAAARPAAESEDEEVHFMDADSGGGSGGVSLEGSAVWADATDQHSPFRGQQQDGQGTPPPAGALPPAQGSHHPANLVIHEEDDAASVASDASTVVHDHSNDQLWAAELAEAEVEAGLEAATGGAVGAAEQAGTADAATASAAAGELAAEPAELPDSSPEMQDAPAPAPRESLLLATAELEAAERQPAADAMSPSAQPAKGADGELFHSASRQLPALEGSLAAAFEGAATFRASLSPAVSAGGRRSSLIGTAQQVAEATKVSLRISLAGGITELHESPTPGVATVDAESAGPEVQHPGKQPPAVLPAHATRDEVAASASAGSTAEPGVPVVSAFAVSAGAAIEEPAMAAAGLAAASSSGGLRPGASHAPALHPEASRLSMASMASSTAAPSLNIEFSEASLRYSVEHMSDSLRSHASQELPSVIEPELPLAAAATPQQHRTAAQQAGASPPAVPANTPASPALSSFAAAAAALRAAGEEHSRPVPAAAVAEAIEQAVAEDAERIASLAHSAADAGSAARAAAPAAADEAGSSARAGSPVPPSPYAATEYDGDDVVMMECDFSPAPTTGRRPPPGSSRFHLEALAAASASRLRMPASSHAPTAQQAAGAAEPEVRQMLSVGPASHIEAAMQAPVSSANAEAVEAAEEGLAIVPNPHHQFHMEQQAAGLQPAAEPAAAVEAVCTAASSMAAPASDAQPHASLPELGTEEAAMRRGRAGRLSMPAVRFADAAERGVRRSRFSLPSSIVGWSLGGEEASEEEGTGDSMAAPEAEDSTAAVELPSPEQLAQQAAAPPAVSSTSLPELGADEVAARRSRNGRLSMPAVCHAGAAEHGRGRSRLSLPSSAMPWAATEDALAFASRPKLASSPAAAAAAPAPPDDDEQQQDQTAQLPAQQETAQPEELDSAAAQATAADQPAGGEADAEPAPFVLRSRLHAEDDELPADVAAPAAAVEPEEEEEEQVQAMDEDPPPGAAEIEDQAEQQMPPSTGPTAQQPEQEHSAAQAVLQHERAEQQQRGVDEAALADAAFAAKPELAMSPASSSGTQGWLGHSHQEQQQQREEDEEALAAAAFAAKPKLAMSPAVSSGSRSQLPSSRQAEQGDEDEVALAAAAFAPKPKLAMSPAISSGSQARPSSRCSPADSKPAQPDVTYAAAAAAASLLAQQASSGASGLPALSPGGAQVEQQQQQHDSPTMSSNPLAGEGNTPVPSSRRFSHSPAPSGLSAGAVSNNPMFAGTPSHPTPPSVNLKSFTVRASGAEGTPQSAGSGGSTPASTGIKLAEKLHQVAEQLQNPAAPQGLAALATPGGARMSAGGRTPTGRFDFNDDVQAIFQALDARTPATALGQQPALGRAAAAVATTVQRQQGVRMSRYSFAAAGNNLLDLDSFDVNGNRSGQAGPTPLLRQQLLGRTPGMPAGIAVGTAPRSAGTAAATPLEVKALRDEVAALRLQVTELSGQREEMVGLLGGYQSSIRELQDKHSVLVVRLQGENAALKAEIDELRREHGSVDEQFRTLYNDKYVPLKTEAAGLRQELSALQKRMVAEELKAHKAASDAHTARQELVAVQQRLQDYKAALAEAQAEVSAAREAEQRLQQQLAGEQRRLEKAVAAKDSETGELRAKYASLTKQYDEAVHRINLAKQARERAQVEVHRKEEEVVALEVRLKEYEGALREYKKENGKFFEMKERYKATIAGLEKEVQAKEREKHELLGMCNELMTRLEREGLAI